jgi:hypothetical protein
MNSLLKEGISDAIGFVVGALAGYLLARLLGFDLFAQGYGSSSIVAILLVGLGGGLGLQASRKYILKKDKK